jgi:hypothetical protein
LGTNAAQQWDVVLLADSGTKLFRADHSQHSRGYNRHNRYSGPIIANIAGAIIDMIIANIAEAIISIINHSYYDVFKNGLCLIT